MASLGQLHTRTARRKMLIPNRKQFRSDIEFRWAFFFWLFDMDYWYEPEDYRVPGLYYQIDFYLPALGYLIEIKPANWIGRKIVSPEQMWITKLQQVVKYHLKETYLLCGNPGARSYEGYLIGIEKYVNGIRWGDCSSCAWRVVLGGHTCSRCSGKINRLSPQLRHTYDLVKEVSSFKNWQLGD